MHKAETSLGTGALIRDGSTISGARALFLSIAGSRVNARTLAESLGVADGSVPALQLDIAVIHVFGITIANSGENRAA